MTAAPAGEGDTRVVTLCYGDSETFDTDVPNVLLALIAQHIDDPDGGVIDCADEWYGRDADDEIFSWFSFARGSTGEAAARITRKAARTRIRPLHDQD